MILLMTAKQAQMQKKFMRPGDCLVCPYIL